MGLDPRSPVIVGVGQYKQQLDDVTQAREQYQLMVEALRLAAVDAGSQGVLSVIDRLVVVGGTWRYPDPGRLVADAVGSKQARTLLTTFGGNIPQACISDAGERIQSGEVDVVVVTGGEAIYSRRKLRALDRDLGRTGYDLAPAESFGAELPMSSEHETSMGFSEPRVVYPLFESAVRAASGLSVNEHLAHLGALWADFNAVAVANQYAWIRTPMSAEEIVTPTAANRMVASPYTKAMNSNAFVDFGGAIIMCSVERAGALGIARDRWVFLHSASDGHASPLFSERDNFHSSPAIRHTATKALELAGVDIDEVAYMDLYSCFPSVVQITMGELGIRPGRRVTTTGGLPFFGGPMNSYVVHAIASTVELVRNDSGSFGFVHANGGYATKHACAVYNTQPPARRYRRVDVQHEIDGYPIRSVDESPDGFAMTESFTVLHDREGPERALVTAIMADGRRALATAHDPDVLATMMVEEFVGRDVQLSSDGVAQFD